MQCSVFHISGRSVAGIGVGGYMGNINITQFPDLAGRKDLYGLFFVTEIAGRLGDPGIAGFRPGFRFSAIHEDGEYAAFRQEGEDQNLLTNTTPNKYVLSIAPTIEFVAKKKNIQGGVQFYPGITFTGTGYSALHLNIAFHLSYKRLTTLLQVSTDYGGVFTTGIYYRIPLWN